MKSSGAGVLLVVSGLLLGCDPWFAKEPTVAGDTPSVNRATATRSKDVPYCPGGDRDKACVFGTNCRVTSEGCQVCQCNNPQ